MSSVKLNAENIKEASKSFMELIADKFLGASQEEVETASDILNNMLDNVLPEVEATINKDTADQAETAKAKEEILNATNETEAEKQEKIGLLVKLRDAVKKLDSKVFKPKYLVVGLQYRRAGGMNAVKDDTARTFLDKVGEAFNIAIDCLAVTFKVVVEFMAFLIQNLMTCALGFVRMVVNKILKVEAEM